MNPSQNKNEFNVNFIGRGLEGIKRLRAKNLLIDSPANAKQLLIDSPVNARNSPENYYIPSPPENPRTTTTRNTNRITNTNPIDYYKDLFLSKDKILKINSVNCGFKIIDDCFYKVQISEVADPLINEVVFIKELTNTMENAKKNPDPDPDFKAKYGNLDIFPKYIDHFFLPRDTLNGIPEKLNGIPQNSSFINNCKNFKVLVTEALTNPISLYDVIDIINKKTTSVQINYKLAIIKKINELMHKYSYYGEKLGFIHSDLHLNNIQVEKWENDNINESNIHEIDFKISNLNLKIIDFGRCFIKDEEQLKINYYDTDIFTKFNIKKSLNFENEFRLKNINKLGDPNAYLCDVAHVALCLLINGIIPNKDWFRINAYVKCGYYIEINLDALENPETVAKLTVLENGLIWLSSYLISCSKNITNGINQDLNDIFGKAIIIYNNTKDDSYIYRFDLKNTMDNTLLISNGMFNPIIFSEDESVQKDTNKYYNIIKIQPTSGGSNKKLKNKKKLTSSRKMYKGGASRFTYFKEQKVIYDKNYVNNDIDKPIDLKAKIQQQELKAEIDSKKQESIQQPELKNYNAPNKEIENLGKSIYQIFLEEGEKTKIFNNYFQKKECNINVCNKIAPTVATKLQACDYKRQSLSLTGIPATGIPATAPATAAAAAAGGSKSKSKSYILHTCKETKRKYIRKAMTRWYLDENRGKYKYLNSDKTHLVLK